MVTQCEQAPHYPLLYFPSLPFPATGGGVQGQKMGPLIRFDCATTVGVSHKSNPWPVPAPLVLPHICNSSIFLCFHPGLVGTGCTGNWLRLSLLKDGWGWGGVWPSSPFRISCFRWKYYGLFYGFQLDCETLWCTHQQLCNWCCVISLILVVAVRRPQSCLHLC